jgi:geranylgeranyl reductase family protein
MADASLGSHWDAVVIGAGPAGSACAYQLARRGRRVLLLDRRTFPREKSCGDGLTPYCLRLLDEMGVLDRIGDAGRVSGARIVHRGPPTRHRDFPYGALAGPYNYGLVVPRMRLDKLIAEAAVAAGAVLSEGTRGLALGMEAGRAIGVEVELADGSHRFVRASIVVAADGAASRFADRQHPGAGGVPDLGTALRGYFQGIEGLEPLQEIHLPLMDRTGAYVLPSYGWIFPTGPDSANIGVGLFTKVPFDNVRALYQRFVDELLANDPRFAHASPVGTPIGAPLRFDFNPERCAAPGLLLVGDAAGLTSPFTGEGISYGIESGRIAAETIDRCLSLSPDAPPIEEDYRTILGDHFAGYFEAGRRSAQRHRLIWQVLDGSFDSERPVFGLLRRLVLVPEGAGGSAETDFLDDLTPLLPRGDLLLRRQMIDIGALLVQSVRRDWPFLGRLEQARRSARNLTFRPSLLMLLAARFGDAATPGLTSLAAALDLAYLGILAQSGIEEEEQALDAARGNWSNKFAVLLSDYLMVRALELSTPIDWRHSERIIGAFEQSCHGHLAQLATAWRADVPIEDALEHLADKAAPLFELPCVLGAVAAGAGPAEVDAMRCYGRALALAFTLTEEQRALLGVDAQPTSALAADLSRGVLGIPILLASSLPGTRQAMTSILAHQPVDRQLLAKLIRDSDSDRRVVAMAESHAQSAREALSLLPREPHRLALERIADYSVSREINEPVFEMP